MRGFIWSAEYGLKEIVAPGNAYQLDVTSMNNKGEVAGYYTITEGKEDSRAFMWSLSDGAMNLGSLIGPNGMSIATKIDDDETVTGFSEGPSTNYDAAMGVLLADQFLWTPATGMRPIRTEGSGVFSPVSAGGKLELPDGANCLDVRGTSPNGQAVGYAGVWVDANPAVSGDARHCKMLWALAWTTQGTAVPFAQCGSKPWCGTTVYAINNRGVAVGFDEISAFRWHADTGFDRLRVDGAVLAAINDKGDAAGAASVAGKGNMGQPIVWKASGDLTRIEMPIGSVYGYVVTINENGQVAGNFY